MDLMLLRKRQMSANYLMQEFISSLTFVEIGTIKNIYKNGLRIDVLLPYKLPDNQEHILANVELLQCGNKVASVFIMPKVGDSVLVFNPRSSITTLEADATPSDLNISRYNSSGLKAILVQGTCAEDPDVSIKVEEGGAVTIDSKSTVTINGHLEIAGAS